MSSTDLPSELSNELPTPGPLVVSSIHASYKQLSIDPDSHDWTVFYHFRELYSEEARSPISTTAKSSCQAIRLSAQSNWHFGTPGD